ncbi:MAG: hypothetical protein BGO88_02905 [Flavobacterium sp. 38-13]|uniref:hypothetical protein n=1 Tax=Flavobacterium sp. 38-13 TaxID=1896168 RepID=UPI00095A2A1D|nr:hypothetical protein [Flavobacterium sp. 38-13]OJX54840.1 MAG: hypothetical protein BGO88_02905 [Flavobacterium sp. 38-13]
MERELPFITISGTEFLIEVENLQLVQRGNPANTISIFEMDDDGNGYSFNYCRNNKTIQGPGWQRPDLVRVHLPELVEMDPEGMAAKYGLPLSDLKGKRDLDVMVDKEALELRLKGRLPTMEIAGHVFYVDIHMDMLRPHDDFQSKGIRFEDLEIYYDNEGTGEYIIPYHPGRREFEDVDLHNMVEFPKDLILVGFPHERFLDPIGCNRKAGYDKLHGLKKTPVKTHFSARAVDLKGTIFQRIMDRNRGRLEKKESRGRRPKQGPRKI